MPDARSGEQSPRRMVDGMTPDRERIAELVERQRMLVTALPRPDPGTPPLPASHPVSPAW